MGIKNTLGNIADAVTNSASQAVDEIGSRVNAIVGQANARLGAIYDGGFIGVNANNWPDIKDAIEGQIITPAETELDKFNALADQTDAIKGESAEALRTYLLACAELVAAYISTYRNFITLAETSLQAMQAGDTSNAQAINEAADEIQNEAQQIAVE